MQRKQRKKDASCCGHLIRAVQDLLFALGSAFWEGSTAPTTALLLWVFSLIADWAPAPELRWRKVFSRAPKEALLHICRGLLRDTRVIFPSLCPFLALLAKSFSHALQWKPTHPAHQCHLPVPQLCMFLPDSSSCSASASSSAFQLPPCLLTGSQPPPYCNSAVCSKPPCSRISPSLSFSPRSPSPALQSRGIMDTLPYTIQWLPGEHGNFLFLVDVLTAVMALSSGISN